MLQTAIQSTFQNCRSLSRKILHLFNCLEGSQIGVFSDLNNDGELKLNDWLLHGKEDGLVNKLGFATLNPPSNSCLWLVIKSKHKPKCICFNDSCTVCSTMRKVLYLDKFQTQYLTLASASSVLSFFACFSNFIPGITNNVSFASNYSLYTLCMAFKSFMLATTHVQ